MLLTLILFGTVRLQADEQVPDFAKAIRPLLTEKCVSCHGPQKQEGGLRLDIRSAALRGGDSGSAIVPGSAAKSDLFQRVASENAEKRMPLGKMPLAREEIDRLRAWIDQGARWPDALAGTEGPLDHWAFVAVRRPALPQISNSRWARNAIDHFILTRLERAGIAPSAEADRATLVRRLSLDLTGLPPTVADTQSALGDPCADWYERLVDRLLASPHYGERWARHWLDLARFAESDGYENDRLRPDAWRFRDWVVDALNRDMPYDRFTLEQLAGDLLPDDADPEATARQWVATGFHRNTLYNSAASGDKEEFRTYAIKDRTDTTGLVWLGLTLGCAKCHSHKYDPISQREYYRLYAFFNDTDDYEQVVAGGKAMTLRAVTRPTRVHLRGNFLQPGEEVTPGAPAFLLPLRVRGKTADRLDLANWLIDPANPLTARVAVNRAWQQLFGRGLVPTADNLGRSGQPPSHPELLDWLAGEFVRSGWSQKAIIRTIVSSATYRQASRYRHDAAAGDPENVLLARQNRLRVEAETVRDLALAASGLLDARLGGPSIVPPFPSELPTGQFSSESLKSPTGERHRRSLYIHVQRTLIHPVLSSFDPADPNQPCARRGRSITPMQALTLLNDPTFAECARALAERIRGATPDTDRRVEVGFGLCLARPPSNAEKTVLIELVEEQKRLGAAEATIWFGVARTLLNVEPFNTRE